MLASWSREYHRSHLPQDRTRAHSPHSGPGPSRGSRQARPFRASGTRALASTPLAPGSRQCAGTSRGSHPGSGGSSRTPTSRSTAARNARMPRRSSFVPFDLTCRGSSPTRLTLDGVPAARQRQLGDHGHRQHGLAELSPKVWCLARADLSTTPLGGPGAVPSLAPGQAFGPASAPPVPGTPRGR